MEKRLIVSVLLMCLFLLLFQNGLLDRAVYNYHAKSIEPAIREFMKSPEHKNFTSEDAMVLEAMVAPTVKKAEFFRYVFLVLGFVIALLSLYLLYRSYASAPEWTLHVYAGMLYFLLNDLVSFLWFKGPFAEFIEVTLLLYVAFIGLFPFVYHHVRSWSFVHSSLLYGFLVTTAIVGPIVFADRTIDGGTYTLALSFLLCFEVLFALYGWIRVVAKATGKTVQDIRASLLHTYFIILMIWCALFALTWIGNRLFF